MGHEQESAWGAESEGALVPFQVRAEHGIIPTRRKGLALAARDGLRSGERDAVTMRESKRTAVGAMVDASHGSDLEFYPQGATVKREEQ